LKNGSLRSGFEDHFGDSPAGARRAFYPRSSQGVSSRQPRGIGAFDGARRGIRLPGFAETPAVDLEGFDSHTQPFIGCCEQQASRFITILIPKGDTERI
jgi:hypothetical protein